MRKETLFWVAGVIFLLIGIIGAVYISRDSSDGNKCSDSYPSFDGSCNDLAQHLGAARAYFRRILPAGYATPTGKQPLLDFPNERIISNRLSRDDTNRVDTHPHNMLGAFFWQFIMQDLFQVAEENSQELIFDPFPILETDDYLCTCSDSKFYPPQNVSDRCVTSTGSLSIPIRPSEGTGTIGENDFKVINNVTSFLDLHPIYGLNEQVSNQLRTFKDGMLRMETLTGKAWFGTQYQYSNIIPNFIQTGLPYTISLDSVNWNQNKILTAGDERASDSLGVIAFYMLFAREHNRNCKKYKYLNPTWDDETLFRAARKKNIAQYQRVALYILPTGLWGPLYANQIPPYTGYKPNVDPSISVEFAAAADHVLSGLAPFAPLTGCGLNSTIQNSSAYIPWISQTVGPNEIMSLLTNAGTWENVWRGLMNTRQRPIDPLIHSDIRNIPSNTGGVDLFATALRRARYHGVSNYYALRKLLYGWANGTALSPNGNAIYGQSGCDASLEFSDQDDPIACFNYLTTNATLASNLQQTYKKLNQIELLVGLLSEPSPVPSGNQAVSVGRTLGNFMIQQLIQIRDSDRYWFEVPGYLDSTDYMEVVNTDLKALLKRNFNLTDLEFPTFTVGTSSIYQPLWYSNEYQYKLYYSCEDSSIIS